MKNILDSIPGVSDVVSRWFNDYHCSGYLYYKTNYVTIDDRLVIPVPVNIAIRAEKGIVVTRVPGRIDTVKEDMGGVSYNISLTFEIGNFKALAMPQHQIPVIGEAVQAGQGGLSTAFGSDVVMKIDEFLPALHELICERRDSPHTIYDSSGILSYLGIEHFVFASSPLELRPITGSRIQAIIHILSDLDADVGYDLIEEKGEEK